VKATQGRTEEALMHTLVGIFKMDSARYARQKQELEERIVPLVKHQPGFVSATWSYDRDAGRSFSVVIFESETAARKMAAFVGEQARAANDAGVELESITVAELVAEARK
jgi:hypothetical protein